MKNYLNLVYFLLFYLFSSGLFAQSENESWEFIKEAEYCFIQSFPVNTDIPEGKSRGEHGILVYKMHKDPDIIIQVSAGFNYKSSDSVNVKIDDGVYEFYTDEDTAWAKDDKKTIFAMKKGLNFEIKSISSKGTTVIDTYTLKGFTAAVNLLSKDC